MPPYYRDPRDKADGLYYARDRDKSLPSSAGAWPDKPYYARERDKSDPFASASVRGDASTHYKTRNISSKSDGISTISSGDRGEPPYYREREKPEAYYRDRDNKPDYGSSSTNAGSISYSNKRTSELPFDEVRSSSTRHTVESQQQSRRPVSDDYGKRSRQASVAEINERRTIPSADESIKNKSIAVASTLRKTSVSSGVPEPRSRESSYSSIRSDSSSVKIKPREPVSTTTTTELAAVASKPKDTVSEPKEPVTTQIKEPAATVEELTTITTPEKEINIITVKVDESTNTPHSDAKLKEPTSELKVVSTPSVIEPLAKTEMKEVKEQLIEVKAPVLKLEPSTKDLIVESKSTEIKTEAPVDTDIPMPDAPPVKKEQKPVFPLNRLESAFHDVESLSKTELHRHMKYFSKTPIKSFNEYPFYQQNINVNNETVYPRLVAALSEYRKTIAQSAKVDQKRFNTLKAAWLSYCHVVEAKEQQQLQKHSASATNLSALASQDPVSPSSRSTRHRKNHGDSVRSEAEFLEILADLERQSARDPSLRAKLTSATIPPMIYDPVERDEIRYQDTNNAVLDKAIPYQRLFTDGIDDFTKEEHESFCDAYLAAPKQFGKIAQRMGGLRTFNDCVMHYYRTKKQVDYKAMLAANIRAKRSSKKSKRKLVKRVSSEEEDQLSNAFISDVAASVPPSVKEEDVLPEVTPVAVPASFTPPATEEPAAKWTVMETTLFQQLIMSYGTDFTKIAAALKQKRSVAAVREYFERVGSERGWIKLAASVDDKIRRGLPVALPPKHVQNHVSHQQPQLDTSSNKRKRAPEESSAASVVQSQPPRKVSVAAVEKKSKEDGDSVIVKVSMPQGMVAAVAAAAAKQSATEATDVKGKEEVPVAKPELVVAKPKAADASTSVGSVPATVVAPEPIKSVVLEVFESKTPSTPTEPAPALNGSPVADTKLGVKPSPVQASESVVSTPIVSAPEPKPASPISKLNISGKPEPVSIPIAAATSSSELVGSVSSTTAALAGDKSTLLPSSTNEPQQSTKSVETSSLPLASPAHKKPVFSPPISQSDDSTPAMAPLAHTRVASSSISSSSPPVPLGSLYKSGIETRSEPPPPSSSVTPSPTLPTRTALPPLLQSHQYSRPLLPSISAQSPLYAYSHNQGHKVGSSSAAVDAVFNAAIAAGVGGGPGASLIASETGSQQLPPLPKLHQYHSQPQPMMTPLPPLTVGTAKTVPSINQMQSPAPVLTSAPVSVPTPTGVLEADESMAAAAAALGSLANVSFVRPRQAPQYAPTQQPYSRNLQSSQPPMQQQPPLQQQYHQPTPLSELLKFSLVSDQATSSTLNPLGGIHGGSGSIGASGSITGGISGDNAQVSGTQASTGFDPTHLGLTRESSERFQARSHQQQQQSHQRR